MIHILNNFSEFPIERNFNYVKMTIDKLKIGDTWLIRKGTEISCKINQVVTIKNITDKAVLFEFDKDWIDESYTQIINKQFWLPKSILYNHKQHIKVIYIPCWTNIKFINN